MNKDYVPPFDLEYEHFDLVASISRKAEAIRHIKFEGSDIILRKTSMIESIQSSLAIEANTLSIEQVTDIIEGKRVIGSEREIQEVKSALEAYKVIDSLDFTKLEDLLKTHKLLMNNLDERNGNFRTGNVGVFSGGVAVHMGPNPKFVPTLMEELFYWLKTTKVHPLIKAAVFHYEFEFIHPFNDGNGRMGRFWHSLILRKWNPTFEYIPMETVIFKRQQDYYNAIRESTRDGKSNKFVTYSLEVIDEVLDILIEKYKHDTHPPTIQIQKLMEILDEYTFGLPSFELMNKLGLRNRASFKRVYLDRAVREGYIEMTIPDKPNSKHQRYRKKKSI